jgi:predicted permease
MPDLNALVRAHLAPLALPRRQEAKIVEELTAQLEECLDALRAAGLSDAEAWQEVQRQLPDWNGIREALLETEPVLLRHETVRRWRSRLGDRMTVGLAGDLRAAIRLMVKARGFTAATTAILALAVGANLAIGTMVYEVLLHPLPMPDSDRVVVMGDVYPTITPDDILSSTAPSYVDRLQAVTALESQALMSGWTDTVAIGGAATEIRGMRATASLFAVTGVQPALGRAFTEGDAVPGADRKLILSDGLWRRLYGSDPGVIGRELRLGWTGELYTIVGVMPRQFWFLDPRIEFWMPLVLTAAQTGDGARTSYSYYHVGRLGADASIAQVRAQIETLNAATIKRFPQFRLAELGMHTAVTPIQQALTRDVRPMLYVLAGGAAFLLLIGAINIAGLTLARIVSRTPELSTRLALGAGRARLVRQLVVEGVLLAALGGIAGIAAGVSLLPVLVSATADRIPNAASIAVEWPLVAATLVIALLVGLLIAAVPATAFLGRGTAHALTHAVRRATASPRVRFARRALVVAQVAASVVLLIGAGLLVASIRNLLAVEAGFMADRVLTATIFPPFSRYPDPAAVVTLSNRVLDAIRAVPGVRSAGVTSNIALSGRASPATVQPAGAPPPPGEAAVLPSVVSITPDYFETMATPIVRGRPFSPRDTSEAPLVAIVDQRLAARFWPGENPIGKTIVRGGAGPYTVVGVAGDVRYASLSGLSEPVGAAYFPHTQFSFGRLRFLAVKTTDAPAGVLRGIRAAVSSIDPDLPLGSVQTMEERTARSIMPQRLAAGLTGMFGIVALVLSLLGLYAVLAHIVAQRTREIGIRLALGSTVRQVFQLVFREGMALVAAGLALGALGAAAFGRTLEGLVFAVQPSDPVVLAVVLLASGAIALVACASPAYRAAHIEPVHALSEE